MGFVTKIITWIKVFLAGNIGIIQAVIKFVKELLTLIIDILFPVIPAAKFQSIVMAVRNVVNQIDDWVEKIKAWLLA